MSAFAERLAHNISQWAQTESNGDILGRATSILLLVSKSTGFNASSSPCRVRDERLLKILQAQEELKQHEGAYEVMKW
jgi:hypothetical protein